MPLFSRSSRFLKLLFPPSGSSVPNPRDVGDSVQIVHALFGANLHGGAQLRESLNTIALAVGTNNISFVEPTAGFISFPLFCVVENPDAAARTLEVGCATTSNVDDWGRLGLANLPSTTVIFTRSIPATSFAFIPLPFPLTRGTVWDMRLLAMTGGNNSRVRACFLEVPGELADFATWPPSMATP